MGCRREQPFVNNPKLGLGFALGVIGAAVIPIAGVGLFTWLKHKTGWPTAYGFNCTSKDCFFSYLFHSPALLQQPTLAEICLFVLMWFIPALIIAGLLAFLFQRR